MAEGAYCGQLSWKMPPLLWAVAGCLWEHLEHCGDGAPVPFVLYRRFHGRK